MLVGYEVQYRFFVMSANIYGIDNTDTATSNVVGCAAATVSACAISYYISEITYYYESYILQPDNRESCLGKFVFACVGSCLKVEYFLGLARSSVRRRLDTTKKLSSANQEIKDEHHPRREIELEPAEENLIIETIGTCGASHPLDRFDRRTHQLRSPSSFVAQSWHPRLEHLVRDS